MDFSAQPGKNLLPLILKNLDWSSLGVCRLVSRQWKRVAESLFWLPAIEWHGFLAKDWEGQNILDRLQKVRHHEFVVGECPPSGFVFSGMKKSQFIAAMEEVYYFHSTVQTRYPFEEEEGDDFLPSEDCDDDEFVHFLGRMRNSGVYVFLSATSCPTNGFVCSNDVKLTFSRSLWNIIMFGLTGEQRSWLAFFLRDSSLQRAERGSFPLDISKDDVQSSSDNSRDEDWN